jgi:hypothetical protein
VVGKSQGKRSLGRHRRKWDDNSKIGFREIGYDICDWTQLTPLPYATRL